MAGSEVELDDRERQALRLRFVNLPIGTSVLAVGRKPTPPGT